MREVEFVYVTFSLVTSQGQTGVPYISRKELQGGFVQHWATMGTSSRSSVPILQLDTILKTPHEKHALWRVQAAWVVGEGTGARQTRLKKALGSPWPSLRYLTSNLSNSTRGWSAPHH